MTTVFALRLFRIFFLCISCCYVSEIAAQPDTTARLMNLQQQLPTNDTWWQLFGDTTLDSLIPKAINNNYNLLNAIKNIELAKARMRIQQSAWYPELSFSGSYTPEKNSLGIEHINERNYIGQAALNMSWEIDVFGNIRKNVKSQREYYYASQEDYRGVMVSLIAQLASTYINLRTYQTQLEVARQNLASQKQIVDLTTTRFNTGLASRLDVSQAQSLYLQTKAAIPGIEAAIYSQINSLCVLTGEYSDSLRRQLLRMRPLPSNANIRVAGIPAELIRRRPDIRSAERTIDALAAAVGASRSDWYPKFYLTGSFGFGSDKFEHFFRKENMDWQISPAIKWTFFSGRRLVETTRTAQLQLEEGINDYNNTVLSALQEIDDALMSYNKSQQQLQADREAYQQAQETLSLAVELYRQGLSDYQNVLNSQRDVFNYQNALVTAESNTLLYLIQLYRALGGGWGENN